jgi:hypothetical protein
MRKKLAAVTLILLLMRASGASAAEAAAPPVWRIDQARAEYTIKVHGFYAVTDLAQDKAGTWRARAWQYSRQLDVQVDQNGNFDVIADLPGDEQNKIPSP